MKRNTEALQPFTETGAISLEYFRSNPGTVHARKNTAPARGETASVLSLPAAVRSTVSARAAGELFDTFSCLLEDGEGVPLPYVLGLFPGVPRDDPRIRDGILWGTFNQTGAIAYSRDAFLTICARHNSRILQADRDARRAFNLTGETARSRPLPSGR